MVLSQLSEIEPRLRRFFPVDLATAVRGKEGTAALIHLFEHLRTLQRILHDYVPRRVAETASVPGEIRHAWEEGALMFTDLAGFTPLMEANAARGRAGAEALLGILSSYFAEMIEIISKSGGELLEFTGDALLAVFLPGQRQNETTRAVRAGLRMQRAMRRFEQIETPQGSYSLRMRVGVHHGRFLRADIGTPLRMEHVLLGNALLRAKHTEGAGRVGRVSLSAESMARLAGQFRCEPLTTGYWLAVDDFTEEQLGEYDLLPPRRRSGATILWDRSTEGLAAEIAKELNAIESLACYLPQAVLRMIVMSVASRQVPPNFPVPTVLFANLTGLPEALDRARSGEEAQIVALFSAAVAQINDAVEVFGGVLKKVTYHLTGSDMMIFFGVPELHTDDPVRAVRAAMALRSVVADLEPLLIDGKPVNAACQIGLARGPVFAAEVGEPHGRREFNILGDTVNTAARLMNRAEPDQILLTGAIYREIAREFPCEMIGAEALKGKTIPTPIYRLL